MSENESNQWGFREPQAVWDRPMLDEAPSVTDGSSSLAQTDDTSWVDSLKDELAAQGIDISSWDGDSSSFDSHIDFAEGTSGVSDRMPDIRQPGAPGGIW